MTSKPHNPQKGKMPSEKAGDGKRKLPEPPEAMVTPDKKIPVPTGSSGASSSARRILFSTVHENLDDFISDDMEEVQSKSRFCPEREMESAAANGPGSGIHRQRARVLFGRMPGRDRMNRFFESTEQQVELSLFNCGLIKDHQPGDRGLKSKMYIQRCCLQYGYAFIPSMKERCIVRLCSSVGLRRPLRPIVERALTLWGTHVGSRDGERL